MQAGRSEGCNLLVIDELREMRGQHDPALRGTELARYAEWDGTALAVSEIVSTVAHYLEVGGTPWSMKNTRHWTAWVFFATSRGLDPRTDADDGTLMAFVMAMLENGYAGKTVRDYLRSIVRMVYDIGPEIKASATPAGPACALTQAWARSGQEKHRKRPPVLPLGHIIALSSHLRDTGDVEGWWVIAAGYARALRPVETLRFDPASVQVDKDVLTGHVTRTKKDPATGEVLQVPRLRDGWGDGTALDAGAAWAALVDQQGGKVVSSPSRVFRNIRLAAEAVGLREWLVRSLRRSRATHLLLCGSSLKMLAWLLRHEAQVTTTRYIDALWAYGYDTIRSGQVLLDQNPPDGMGGGTTSTGADHNPARELAAVAASTRDTDGLRARATELLASHTAARRGNLAASTITKATRKLGQLNEWCVEMFGHEIDLDDPSADLIVALWATARLGGKTAYSSDPRTVEAAVDGILLHSRPELSFSRSRQVVAGAMRDREKPHQQEAEATTAEDVRARIITAPAGQPHQQVAQARSNLAHALMWGSAGRISGICHVRQSTMFYLEGLGTVALLGTSKGGRGAPCPRDVLVIPDRDDELDLREHLAVLLELRRKHGVQSDWLMAPANKKAERPLKPNVLRKALNNHAALLGLSHLPTLSYRLGRLKELAENGATQPELQRWLRHGDSGLVSSYTRQADPSWLWRSAMRFVEDRR